MVPGDVFSYLGMLPANFLDLAIRYDIRPIFPARIDQEKIDIDDSGQLGKCLKVEKGQVGNAED